MSKQASNILPVISGALILLLVGLYNQYPLVTSDSGAYINNGFHFEVPKDRTVFYSLFIMLSSLKLSLWLVIIFQALILSYLLNNFLDKFFSGFSTYLKTGILFLSVGFTSVGWYTCQIMPDIFTPLFYLAAVLFLYAESRKDKIILLLIVFVSIIFHTSNLLTSTLLFLALLIFSAFIRGFKSRRLAIYSLLIVACFSWVAVCLTNLFAGNGFKPSKSSHVFIMGKLVENGILKKYLDEKCTDHNYRLCEFRNNLPQHAWDFIWADNGTFAKTGGWDSSETEYSSIIKATLSEPKFLLLNIQESIKATCEQLLLTDAGDGLWAYKDGTNPFWKVQELFQNELNAYLHSRQNNGELSFTKINTLYWYFTIVSLSMVLVILWMENYSQFRLIFFITFLFLVFNAFTTATFANILTRLNSRAIWLLPFLNIAIIINFLKSQRSES